MVGATINGMIAPIDRVPQTGDIVEIITSQASKGPSRDWLKIVRTGEARNKIRQWFKREKRSENIIVGRAEIDREFAKFSGRPTEAQKNEVIANIARRIGMQESDDLLSAIGYGGITMSKISVKLRDEYERLYKPEPLPPTSPEEIKTSKSGRIRRNNGIIIDGEYGCAVKFARCCNPLPGDDIIGFITRGYGISIHKRTCRNITSGIHDPEFAERLVNAEWDTEAVHENGGGLFESVIQILADNRISLLADITAMLAEMKVTLLSVNTQKSGMEDIIINLTVGCKNSEHYNSIVSRLRSISGIINITRGVG